MESVHKKKAAILIDNNDHLMYVDLDSKLDADEITVFRYDLILEKRGFERKVSNHFMIIGEDLDFIFIKSCKSEILDKMDLDNGTKVFFSGNMKQCIEYLRANNQLDDKLLLY